MAGIYIHIPFCKTKCFYCDFFKCTNNNLTQNFLQALFLEIEQRATELNKQLIKTIYIGGGTPSTLSVEQINQIIYKIHEHFIVDIHAEITMECNPDDLNRQYLDDLKKSTINRLSIGIQSFKDCHLKHMNRRHCALQAINAVRLAQEVGFNNINIDLIYGLPHLTIETWKQSIAQAIDLNVAHISAYHLTYHEGTVMYKLLKEGKIVEIPDEESFEQFKLLRKMLSNAGYEHYEISNFAKNKKYSQHNRAYWQQQPYLGLGPSAHSYDIETRRWNISSVEDYISAIQNNLNYFEIETLSIQDKYNDYIITTLRTQWGISEQFLLENFPAKFTHHFLNRVNEYLKIGQIIFHNSHYSLSTTGLFVSDAIMEDLCFFEE
ncbi:MAG: radical SAM family heme chaperone HemW [Mangrovibacterium sp.]